MILGKKIDSLCGIIKLQFPFQQVALALKRWVKVCTTPLRGMELKSIRFLSRVSKRGDSLLTPTIRYYFGSLRNTSHPLIWHQQIMRYRTERSIDANSMH